MTRGESSRGTDQVLPEAPRSAQARHVGQIVETPARVEQLLVIATLDPLEVDPVQEIALEAVAQPRRTDRRRAGPVPARTPGSRV